LRLVAAIRTRLIGAQAIFTGVNLKLSLSVETAGPAGFSESSFYASGLHPPGRQFTVDGLSLPRWGHFLAGSDAIQLSDASTGRISEPN
jgi:hypothetical protein